MPLEAVVDLVERARAEAADPALKVSQECRLGPAGLNVLLPIRCVGLADPYGRLAGLLPSVWLHPRSRITFLDAGLTT
jgi:hypothetical protein